MHGRHTRTVAALDSPSVKGVAVLGCGVGLLRASSHGMTAQQIRNLLMDLADRAADFRFLVRDRAGQFTGSFDAVLASSGIEAVRIPPRSPRANAYAERFVLTARTEVTDRMLIFGERHLRLVMTEYEAHYNGRRPRDYDNHIERREPPFSGW
jgi:transposase InsO family protein